MNEYFDVIDSLLLFVINLKVFNAKKIKDENNFLYKNIVFIVNLIIEFLKV